jgi:predicted nucleic acid-binding protein
MGTVALLGQAKREGLIPKLKPALNALMANGIFIRQELIEAALKEAGE